MKVIIENILTIGDTPTPHTKMTQETTITIEIITGSILFLIYYIISKNKKKSNTTNNKKPILNDKNKYYQKGVEFEKYIASLFNEKYFSIYDWTRDNSLILERKVETDSNPDLTFRHLATNQLISIECKFRSQMFNNGIDWARHDQIINYLSYASRTKIPTFIVIGLGGTPRYPNRLFCIPIEEAKYTNLFISKLKRFERPPNKPFYWYNKKLN